MFQGKYQLNHLSTDLDDAFGLTKERTKEVMGKLLAVAQIYPNYIVISEVWLNCDRFTDKEKALGMFILGKIFGLHTLTNKLKLKMVYPVDDLEGKILKYILEGKRDMNKLTKQLLKQGSN